MCTTPLLSWAGTNAQLDEDEVLLLGQENLEHAVLLEPRVLVRDLGCASEKGSVTRGAEAGPGGPPARADCPAVSETGEKKCNVAAERLPIRSPRTQRAPRMERCAECLSCVFADALTPTLPCVLNKDMAFRRAGRPRRWRQASEGETGDEGNERQKARNHGNGSRRPGRDQGTDPSHSSLAHCLARTPGAARRAPRASLGASLPKWIGGRLAPSRSPLPHLRPHLPPPSPSLWSPRAGREPAPAAATALKTEAARTPFASSLAGPLHRSLNDRTRRNEPREDFPRGRALLAVDGQRRLGPRVPRPRLQPQGSEQQPQLRDFQQHPVRSDDDGATDRLGGSAMPRAACACDLDERRRKRSCGPRAALDGRTVARDPAPHSGLTPPSPPFPTGARSVKCDPYVEITYENNKTAHIETKDMNVEQIMQQINSVAEQMDTLDKLKAAGIAGQPLHSTWTSAPGRETGMGRRSNIPRQV